MRQKNSCSCKMSCVNIYAPCKQMHLNDVFIFSADFSTCKDCNRSKNGNPDCKAFLNFAIFVVSLCLPLEGAISTAVCFRKQQRWLVQDKDTRLGPLWSRHRIISQVSQSAVYFFDKMSTTTGGGEFGNPLRKFKLVFLGEQSGKMGLKYLEKR